MLDFKVQFDSSSGIGAKYKLLFVEMLYFIIWYNYNCSQFLLQTFGFFCSNLIDL